MRDSSRRNFLSGQVIGVRTGELLRSVEIDPRNLPKSIAIGSRLPQAGVLHFGWPAKNIRARPYLFPAVNRERSRLPPVLIGEIEKAWNRAASRVRG